MKMPNKKVMSVIIVLLIIIIIMGILIFQKFCAIHFADIFGSLTCTALVFDKEQMLTVDRIVFYNYQTDKEFSVTDLQTINMFVNETMVATNTDIQCPKDVEIKLYSKNKLIRTMYCGIDYYFVNVHNADKTHWFLLKGTESEEGFVLLSKELRQLLLSIG